jgi:hypothetical protein
MVFVKVLTLVICVVDPYTHSFGFPESGSRSTLDKNLDPDPH